MFLFQLWIRDQFRTIYENYFQRLEKLVNIIAILQKGVNIKRKAAKRKAEYG